MQSAMQVPASERALEVPLAAAAFHPSRDSCRVDGKPAVDSCLSPVLQMEQVTKPSTLKTLTVFHNS